MLVFLVIFPFLLHCAGCNTCYKDDNKDCVQDEFSKINGGSGAFVIGEGNHEGLEDGEDTEKKRFMKILKACGELCDMKRKGTPGKFMNQMRSKVMSRKYTQFWPNIVLINITRQKWDHMEAK